MFTFVTQRLPLYYSVYQPNRCLPRAQDFSILGTETAEAVRLPLNSNTKWMSRVYLCKTALLLREKCLPLHDTVYQPNRCLTRAQDFSILGTETAEAVRLPLNGNTN